MTFLPDTLSTYLISKSLAFALVLLLSVFLILSNRTLANVCADPSNSKKSVGSTVTVPLSSVTLEASALAYQLVASKPLESYAFKSAVTSSLTILNSAVTLEPVKFLFPSTGFRTTVPIPEMFSPYPLWI